MKVKTKIIDKSIPTPPLKYAMEGDAGIDLTATSKSYDNYGNICYGTNRAFEIPKGYVGLLFPRSSNSKQDLILSNCVGVLDSGYRGELKLVFKPLRDVADETGFFEQYDANNEVKKYSVGDRIGQLIIMPYPTIEFQEVDELSTTQRGSGGYGSTGN